MSSEPKLKQNDVVLSDNIFTPVMDVKAATEGFKNFQKLKMEILDQSDIIEIMGNPYVKKSGWNKLALFFGASTRTVLSLKNHNPDGSYEWSVTVEAYKITKDGLELYKTQRSALVSSLEKEKTEGMKNSPRKSHDVFASAETRAEGRALAAFFGSGEVSAEEMSGSNEPNKVTIPHCGCSMTDTKVTDELNKESEVICGHCDLPIYPERLKNFKKMQEDSTNEEPKD